MENKKNEIFIVSVEDTIKYGIIKAAIIGRVRMWCEYNKKNKVKDRFHNGEWWSGFMTYDEFATQLGIPVKTIEKHLPQLIKTGILITDKFNKKGFDRTSWYRVNPSPQIEGMIPPNRGNGNTQIEGMETPKSGEPIPVSHSVNQNVKQTDKLPVNTPVELNEFEKEQLLNLVKNIVAPDDATYWVECLIKNESVTSARKELVRKNINYFNKGKLLPKFLEEQLKY
jgi:hypothetical protein